MHNTNLTLCGCVAALTFFLPSCGGDGHDGGSGSDVHSEDDGHNHDAEAHHEDDGHNHDAEAHDDDDGHNHGADEHEHEGEVHDLGTVSAAGSTISVTVTGDVEPGSELHVELDHSAGAAPAGLRLWVGLESAIGSLKAKASRHGEHFDAHVEVPNELADGAKLWLQVEDASGETQTTSLSLPDLHDG